MSEQDEALTGRKAVRALLIDPLEAEGMKRPRSRTVEEHKAWLTKVADKLSYCETETLERLRPMIAALATGPAKNVWPELITIRNHAHSLQAPPDRSDAILYSWLHSQAGEAARQRGTLLATRLYIKGLRRAPVTDGRADSFKLRQIDEKQREIDLDIERIRRLNAMREATDSELEWLRGQEETLAGLEAIVDAGVRHRAEKQAEQAGAEC